MPSRQPLRQAVPSAPQLGKSRQIIGLLDGGVGYQAVLTQGCEPNDGYPVDVPMFQACMNRSFFDDQRILDPCLFENKLMQALWLNICGM